MTKHMTHEQYHNRIKLEMVESARKYINGEIGFIEAVRALVNTVVALEERESEVGTSLVVFDSETDGLPSPSQYHLWDEKVFNERIKDRIKHAEDTYRDEFVTICKYLIDKYSRIEILEQILADKPNRKQLVSEFQEQVWNETIQNVDKSVLEILSELAYDLDFYEPDEKLRKEQLSYYGDERLEIEISSALKKIEQLNELF